MKKKPKLPRRPVPKPTKVHGKPPKALRPARKVKLVFLGEEFDLE